MKSKQFKIFIPLLIIPVFLAACGSKGSTTSEPASLAMKGTSGNAVNMNGAWKRCVHNNTDGTNQLEIQTFSGGSITLNSSLWSGSTSTTSSCLQTTAPDEIFAATITATMGAESTATWTDGSGSTSPPAGAASNSKATAVTGVFNSATLTPGSDLVANLFNSRALCGKTSWANGLATDVLNCTAVIPATTQTDYWVVDDSGTVLKLYTQDTGTAAYQVDNINPFLR